jgi:hypothetical protein
LVTLVGAISIIGYLEVGQNLRSFMPLMVYAVPVTGERLDEHNESLGWAQYTLIAKAEVSPSESDGSIMQAMKCHTTASDLQGSPFAMSTEAQA